MSKVTVDFSEQSGPIRPLHGVNNGPQTANFWYDATEWFEKAHIPYSRLHDTEYPFGRGQYVDIACIFRDMDADETKEENYNFFQTDDYIRAIHEAGTKTFYRLGSTIEHQQEKKYIYKPKDPEKWARICSHIISHYNEGWADGYHWDIQYWEIWNEPDLEIKPPLTWIGTEQEFFDFYAVVSVLLKKEHPNVHIGGPAIAYPEGGFAERFLSFVAEKKLPLDFFSWHAYLTKAEDVVRISSHVDELLARYGFTDTESIYDEWNFVPSWEYLEDSYRRMGSLEGAAFDAAVLCKLQNTSISKAMYYDAQMAFEDEFNGLFASGRVGAHKILSPVIPKKPYYAFQAFGELYALGTQVKIQMSDEEIEALAATGTDIGAVLLVNQNTKNAKNLELEFEKNYQGAEVYLLDEEHNLERIGIIPGKKIVVQMPPCAVVLVKVNFSKADFIQEAFL